MPILSDTMHPTNEFRLTDIWDKVEAAIGLVAVFVIAFGPLTIAVATLLFATLLAEWRVAGIAACVIAITSPMAIWLKRMADSALRRYRSELLNGEERHRSFGTQLAAELPPLPLVARLPLAIWWLAHYLAGSALVNFRGVLIRERLVGEWVNQGLSAVVFAHLFSFAASVFLALAIAACFGSSKVTACAWRHRFSISIAVTVPVASGVA